MKNKKINYLINQFKLTEEDAKKISDTCSLLGVEKYLIWIAKEYKKDKNIIQDTSNLIYIFDWVKKENADILKYNFKDSMSCSQECHKKNFKLIEKEQNRNIAMNDGVIYKCKDGKHFFKILTASELKEEGELMGNCVGGSDYQNKVKNEKSIIISLRDEKNLPHVDIEIDAYTGKSLQVFGKAVDGLQSAPIKKYQNMILEYAFYALGVNKEVDQEVINIMLK